MPTLLITGASGFLGWHLCQAAQQHWQVHGTYHRQLVSIPNTTLHPVDLTDVAAVKTLLQTLRPAAVIHAAALSQPNQCQENPELSHQINVLASWNLAALCAELGIRCLFTSSEQVFDGKNPPYRETDSINPLNLYGEQKALAEQGMRDRHPDVILCRMPLMYGAAPAPSFIQPFIQRLRSGQVLQLFTDEIRTPVSGGSAATGLLLMLDRASGLVHLGGRERLSRYEMGQLLVEVLQIADAKMGACLQADVPMAAPRAPDLSMDSSLAFSLGYAPGLMRDELQRMVDRL